LQLNSVIIVSFLVQSFPHEIHTIDIRTSPYP